MSDGLRDALEKQAAIWEGFTSNDPDVQGCFELAAGKLRELLAATSARGIAEGGGTDAQNPADSPSGELPGSLSQDTSRDQASVAEGGGVTDEAVEDFCREAWPKFYEWDERTQAVFRRTARHALELRPLLGLQQVPTVLLDRSKLFNVLVEFIMAQPQRADVVEYDEVLDAVMELAQQVPSREEICEALHHDNHDFGDAACRKRWEGDLTNCYERTMHNADAVLALFSKPAEEDQ